MLWLGPRLNTVNIFKIQSFLLSDVSVHILCWVSFREYFGGFGVERGGESLNSNSVTYQLCGLDKLLNIPGLSFFASVKQIHLQCRRCGFSSWVRKISWRRPPTLVFLPGIYHGQRSLVVYSSWGLKRVKHGLETKQQQRGRNNVSLTELLEDEPQVLRTPNNIIPCVFSYMIWLVGWFLSQLELPMASYCSQDKPA